jgi:hypothetical protein
MNQDIRQHGTFYQMVGSLPIVGAPSKFLMDFTRMGIDQYGYLLGTLRGGLVGVVMFGIMLFLSEAIPLGWTIIRYYFDLRNVQPVLAEIRVDAVQGHKRDALNLSLGWLDPGRYLLRSDPPPEEQNSCSGSPVKGCLWPKLSRGEKFAFVIGLHEAAVKTPVLWATLFARGRSVGDTVKGLDEFYSDSSNTGVLLIDAMKKVRDR